METLNLEQLEKRAKEGTLIGPVICSNKDYHAGPGVSKSKLDKIAKSPMQFRHDLENPKKQTPDMLMGSLTDLFHCGGLEEVEKNYLIIRKISRATKEGKTYWAEQMKKAAELGLDLAYETDMEKAKTMSKAIAEHTVAGALTRGPSQISFYWIDEVTGLLCKCRPDFMPIDGVLCDMKVSHYFKPSMFKKAVGDFRYHVQDAFYIHGVTEALKQSNNTTITPPKYFVFVSVQNEAPHDVGVYRLDEAARQLGTDHFRADLNTYKACVSENRWPGVCNRIIDISLPAWNFQQKVVGDE